MTRKVSVTELRKHMGRYIDLVISGDVLVITRYGKEIAMLVPFRDDEQPDRTNKTDNT